VGLKDLLPIIFERSNAMQRFWNFLIVVTFGLLGFVTTARATAGHTSVKVMLTIGYVVFAAVNLDALLFVTQQRTILVAALPKLPSDGLLKDLNEKFLYAPNVLSPPFLGSVITVHLVVDAFVVGAIWLFPWLLKNRR
jgi:hypothetical protein